MRCKSGLVDSEVFTGVSGREVYTGISGREVYTGITVQRVGLVAARSVHGLVSSSYSPHNW